MKRKRNQAKSPCKQIILYRKRAAGALFAGILVFSFAAGCAAAYADTDIPEEEAKAQEAEETAASEEQGETNQYDPESTGNDTQDDNREESSGNTESDFSCLELLVKTAEEDSIIGTVEGSYGDVYLISYETEEETEEAYTYYSKEALAVEVNEASFDVYPNSVSEENEQGNEDATETESTANDSGTTSDDPKEDSAKDSQENALEILSDTTIRDVSDSSSTKKDDLIIALIDTGVSADCDVIDAISVIDDNPQDQYGHGTQMYETIKDRNPDALILSIKAFGSEGTTDAASIYAAIQYAVEAGADIINCSFSAGKSETNSIVADALSSAAASGIIVVGAAGNNGTDASGTIPGGIEEVYVFGSLADQSKKRYFTSNYGDTVDGYLVSGSTSYAAAIASAYFAAGYSFEEMVAEGLVYTSYTGVTPVIEQDIDESLSSDRVNLFGDMFVVAESVDRYTDYYDILSAGGYMSLTHGSTYYYGSYSTTKTYISDSVKYIAGTTLTLTFTGYCLEPNEDSPPDGEYYFDQLEGQNTYASRMISAYILISECSALWTEYGDEAYPMCSSSSDSYAWCHALISYVYFGNKVLTGISAYESQVKSSVSYVEDLVYDSSELLYAYVENSVLYHFYASDDGYQDIVFLLWETPETTGYLDIHKTASNTIVINDDSYYSMAGIQYTVYTDSSCTTVATDADGNKAVFTLDSSGSADTVELEVGTYYVKETYIPAGCNYDMDTSVYSVTIEASSTIPLTVEDTPLVYPASATKSSGSTTITDNNSCYSLTGAVYTIYTNSSCTTVAKDENGNAAVLTTDENGDTETIYLSAGTYYVKETTAPPGYELDTSVQTVTLTSGGTETVTFSFNDTPITASFDLSLYKGDSDSLTMEAQADAGLEGAIFEISLYGNASGSTSGTALAVWYFVTDENGEIDISTDDAYSGTYTDADGNSHTVSSSAFYYLDKERAFPLGTYVVKEVSAPKYYKLSGTICFANNSGTALTDSWDITEGIPFLVSEGTGTYADTAVFTVGGTPYTESQFSGFSIFAYDEIRRAEISITKLGDDAVPIEGAVFQIVGTTSGVVDEAALWAYSHCYDSVEVSGPDEDGNTTVTYSATTDANGEIILEGLLPMSYTITEEKGIEEYTLLADNIEITLPILYTDIKVSGASLSADSVYYDNMVQDYCFFSASYLINETAVFTIPQAGAGKAGLFLTFSLPFLSAAGLILVLCRRRTCVQI